MQFQVPQFIEVEDKIFGPLTFRQFVYLGGGIGASYLISRLVPTYVAGPVALTLCGLAAALAFLQFNGRPFIVAMENAFFYLIHSKLYLWSNVRRKKTKQEVEQVIARPADVFIPKLSESRLHELAWSLDIRERIAGGIATEDERVESHQNTVDALSTIHTAEEARASKSESLAQQVERLARERAQENAHAIRQGR